MLDTGKVITCCVQQVWAQERYPMVLFSNVQHNSTKNHALQRNDWNTSLHLISSYHYRVFQCLGDPQWPLVLLTPNKCPERILKEDKYGGTG